MKSFLFLTFMCLLSFSGYAQNNPYAIFGYKVKKQPPTTHIDIYAINNHDPHSNIRYMIINREEKVIKLLDKKDSVLQVIPYTDEDILRWTSIDPHAEKYYSWNPYNYVFNNPIKMVDKNGMDGEVTGSGTKKDPYIIKANYYYVKGDLSDKQVQALNDGISAYNKLGGKDGVEIKNADGTKSFVKYNLSASGVDNADAAKTAAKGDKFTDINGTSRQFGNYVRAGAGSGSGEDYGWSTNRSVNFTNDDIQKGVSQGMSESRLLEGIVIHEIGHNLGGEDNDGSTTMQQVTSTTVNRDISTTPGGASSTTFSYPGVSKDFTRTIFSIRDTRNQGAT
ncbi:MAG: hypothetical protein JST19_06615, partial [Bacteroidetes bacterium]|nr:hypothetical protein [Bacteroidota bacterium]